MKSTPHREPLSSPTDQYRSRKQAVTTHTQELEELEARLRATEERLKQAKSSPPSRKASQRQTHVQGTDKARSGEAGSPLAVRQKTRAVPQAATGVQSESPISENSTEYVLVDRPSTAQSTNSERA